MTGAGGGGSGGFSKRWRIVVFSRSLNCRKLFILLRRSSDGVGNPIFCRMQSSLSTKSCKAFTLFCRGLVSRLAELIISFNSFILLSTRRRSPRRSIPSGMTDFSGLKYFMTKRRLPSKIIFLPLYMASTESASSLSA